MVWFPQGAETLFLQCPCPSVGYWASQFTRTCIAVLSLFFLLKFLWWWSCARHCWQDWKFEILNMTSTVWSTWKWARVQNSVARYAGLAQWRWAVIIVLLCSFGGKLEQFGLKRLDYCFSLIFWKYWKNRGSHRGFSNLVPRSRARTNFTHKKGRKYYISFCLQLLPLQSQNLPYSYSDFPSTNCWKLM